jgi:hypothetical protein
MQGSDWKGEKFTPFSELIGVDDKGVYVTTKRGRYRAGDLKGGKLRGQAVSYRSGAKGGPLSINQAPSYLISQGTGVMPIQVQNAIGWMAGELNWFDALTKGVGMYTSTTYPTKAKTEKGFVDEYVNAISERRSLVKIIAKIREYNLRRRKAGKPEDMVETKRIIAKARKLIQANRMGG